ncbi:hypothetical protein GYA13_00565 [Candidatus Kuenenbacteria bacterium]|nr:hypothetical protein [Candidatus Kuenenbacteria bacterium]
MQNEKFVTNAILDDGELVEMIYRPEYRDTRLLAYKDEEEQAWEKIELDNVILAPYPADLELIDKGVVLFPSGIELYNSEFELISEIQNFIHKYLDISSTFEIIASYYVLLTYLYDKLPNILYLRFTGDFGSGKSRALEVIGNLCYRPMFASGAISTSAVFRIIDKFRGTLVLDEADFANSDTYAEIIKILNCGYERGKPVLRSEGDNKKKWDVKAFNCYCPKIIATRFGYKDLALESRCLTEVMAKAKLREDIPLNLPNSFQDEATQIRNKLLLFRFKNFNNNFQFDNKLDKSIEPRLRQITNSILCIIKDERAKKLIEDFIIQYNQQLIDDRSLGFESKIIEAIYNLKDNETIFVKNIAEEYNRARDDQKELTSGSIGKILRNKLQIKTKHSRDGRYIAKDNKERLEILFSKYGFSVNDVKDVNDNTGIEKNENTNIGQISFS